MIRIPRETRQRFRAAIRDLEARVDKTTRVAVMNMMIQAHRDTLAALDGACSIEHPELALALSVLDGPERTLLETLDSTTEAVVQPDGSIRGLGRYEDLDYRWLEAGAEWCRNLFLPKHPFGTKPSLLAMPEGTTTIALLGDWATGYWQGAQTPAARVAAEVARRSPHYTIHLGDEYYAGKPHEEHNNLVEIMPRGSLATIALNSNHAMYNGCHGFFDTTLHAFTHQNKTSYCALENTSWIVLCLDSAYHASEIDLYSPGSLQHGSSENSQTAWVSSFAERARYKRVIVLSHHQCLSFDGTAETQLHWQVTQCLGRVPDLWFFGHAHNAIVYAEHRGMRARCAGHGAIPHGHASALDSYPCVLWHETRLAAGSDIRVCNGFVLLTLDGDGVCEQFIAEDGRVAWSC